MKNIYIFFFVFLSLSASCKEKTHDSFEYQYDVPSDITFDFQKSYSVPVGSVTLTNKESKTKKFRYINNSPLGYFFNRRTKQIYQMGIVPHNADTEKLDSVFWAVLGSATYHTPVKPYSSTKLTLYLNINANPNPKEIIEYLLKNYQDLEYHIFNPDNFPPNTGEKSPPSAIIRSIKVIRKQTKTPSEKPVRELAEKRTDKKKIISSLSVKKELIEKLKEAIQPYPFDSKKETEDTKDESAKKDESLKKDTKDKIVKKDTIEENPSKAQEERNSCTVELKVEGVIGVAVLDIIEQAIYKVKEKNCSALLLLINTPGGQLLTTRKIVDRILNTDFPVLCLIHPAGAHAGSAGAIIMQACHVNGGIETTNIGAATPIAGGGQKISEDLRKKLINDTVSWLDSLTQLRKRSKKFGREIVTEAKALSASSAKKEGGIDFVGKTKREFLQFAEGKTVNVRDGKQNIVQVGEIIPMNLGFRYRLVSLLTEPQIIYILFTGSLLLLYYEITHPGLGAPGVLGAIGLVLSFLGMHTLDFSWAGLILLLLSVALFLAELFISGFGIFGAGAIISFLLGSFLLFDPAKTGGVDIPVSLILSVTSLFAIFMGTLTYLAFSTFKKKKPKISDDLMSDNALPAEVVHVNKDGLSGLVFVNGENWRFECDEIVKKGDKVKVLSCSHLILKVKPVREK